jgi:hypothetical protein
MVSRVIDLDGDVLWVLLRNSQALRDQNAPLALVERDLEALIRATVPSGIRVAQVDGGLYRLTNAGARIRLSDLARELKESAAAFNREGARAYHIELIATIAQGAR